MLGDNLEPVIIGLPRSSTMALGEVYDVTGAVRDESLDSSRVLITSLVQKTISTPAGEEVRSVTVPIIPIGESGFEINVPNFPVSLFNDPAKALDYNGDYTLSILLQDRSDNSGSPASLTITVDDTLPTPTPTPLNTKIGTWGIFR